jgi:transformer-2 protein
MGKSSVTIKTESPLKHLKMRSSSRSSRCSKSRSKSRENRSRNRRCRRSRENSSRRHRSSRHHHRCSSYIKFRRGRSSSRSSSSSSDCYRRKRYYGTRENPNKSRVVGIFGLSSTTNEAKLMEVFEPFGAVERVNIVYDAKTENSRGFGFVYYQQVEQASAARRACNGIELDGRRIRVDYSITKRAHTPTPGVYMGRSKSPERRHRRRGRSNSRSRSR